MEFKTIAVIGSREFNGLDTVKKALDDVTSSNEGITIRVHGRGNVDEFVEQYCMDNGIALAMYPMRNDLTEDDSEEITKANKLMFDGVDLVIIAWDGESIGTKNALDLVTVENIPHFVIVNNMNPLEGENNTALVICDSLLTDVDLIESTLLELGRFIMKDTLVRFISKGTAETELEKKLADHGVAVEYCEFEITEDKTIYDIPEETFLGVGLTFIAIDSDNPFYLNLVERYKELNRPLCFIDYRIFRQQQEMLNKLSSEESEEEVISLDSKTEE